MSSPRAVAIRRGVIASVVMLALPAQSAVAQTAVSLPIRINAGGGLYTDSRGAVWSADVGFEGGEAGCSPCDAPIAGTSDPEIYRSQRSSAGAGAALAYRFLVPNGTYQVRLHLAETAAAASGRGLRVFDVKLEGRVPINDLDIFDSVGAQAALVRVVTARVTDGQLDLELVDQVGRAQVGGIEILPVPSIGSRRYRLRDLGLPSGVPEAPNTRDYIRLVTPVDMSDSGWIAANGLGGPYRWNPNTRGWEVRNGTGPAGAINDSGSVLWTAGWTTECPGNCGFVWRTNGETALPGSAVALNDAETVAYAVNTASPPFTALFVLRNGASTPLFLGAPPSAGNPLSTYGGGMNARGWITGTAFNQTGSTAFLWNGTTMRDLGTLGGNSGQGAVINDAGWVAGHARDPSGKERAFLWDGVTMRDIGNLGSYAIYPKAINESGWFAGEAATPPIGMGEAFVWDGESLLALGKMGGSASRALDIDEWGWVVGAAVGTPPGSRAFLWANGEMRDLNDLISTADPLAPQITLTEALRINSRGWVLASGMDLRTGRWRAFIVYPEDLTPPSIAAAISGQLGNQGWYRSNVTIRWTVADSDGDVLESRNCGDAVVSSDTAGATLTCEATSEGGTASRSVTIKRDATAPLATAAPTRPPNDNGWFTEGLTIRFQGSDALSGIAACSPDVQVQLEGSSVSSAAGVCSDNAGNASAEARAEGLRIDLTPPSVTSTRFPFANAAGWSNEPVTVSFSGTDATSGIAGCSSAIVLSLDGAGQSAGGRCTDKAGLVGTLLVTDIRIDRTPPTAVAQASQAANAAGWYREPVTVSFSGADAMSGSGIASCTAPIALSGDGRNQTATGTCLDRAGNPSLAATLSVNVDRTAPSVSITSPENGASFAQGAVLAASFTCSDATSGVARCEGTVPAGSTIPTDTPGSRSFTVTATDAAGNTSTSTVTYTITPSPPKKSGGGGALSGWMLMMLALYALGRNRWPACRLIP